MGWTWRWGRSWRWDLLPLTIQLEEAGQRVPWGLVVEPAQEGPPLLPLGPGPMEVDGAEQAPEDGAMVEDAVGRAGQLFTILRMAVVLPIVAVGVGVLFGGHVWGGWTCAAVQNRQTDLGSWLVSWS